MIIDDEIRDSQKRKEEYKTADAYLKHLQEKWHPEYTDQQLGEIFAKASPEVHVMSPEDPERAIKSALSAHAREMWMNHLVNKTFFHPADNLGVKSMNRGVNALFRNVHAYDSPKGRAITEQNNEMYRVLSGNDAEAKKAIVIPRLRDMRDTVRRCAFMSDADLVDNFEDIFSATQAIIDLEALKASGEDFVDDEVKSLIDDVRMHDQGTAMKLAAKLKIIANPVYGQVDITSDEFAKLNYGQVQAEGMQMNASFPTTDLYEFAFQCFMVGEALAEEKASSLQGHLAEKQEELKNIRLRTAEGKDNGTGEKIKDKSMIALGDPIVAAFPNGDTTVIFMQEDQNHKTVFSEIKADLFRPEHAQELKALETVLEDVDPLLMKSSSQFKNMKAALKSAGKHYKADGDITNKADRDALREKLTELSNTAFEYIKFKQGSTKQGIEQKRIQAANQVQEYALNMLAKLDLAENALSSKVPAQIETESAAVKQEAPRRRAPKQEMPAADVQYVGKTEVLDRAVGYSGMSFHAGSGTSNLNSEADNLLREAQMGLSQDKINRLYNTKRFDAKEKAAARHQMAAMVAVDLIRRERQANVPGERGSWETVLNEKGRKAFIDSIEKSDFFRERTKEITPQSYARFIAGKKEQDFSKEMLKESLKLHPKEQNKKRTSPAKTAAKNVQKQL